MIQPELRFYQINGEQFPEYEQVSLGELYTERNEKGNSSLPILTISIHSGVSDGEADEDELGKRVSRSDDKSLYKRVYEGDLAFNMMRAWQGAIGVVKSEGMISPAYIAAKIKHASENSFHNDPS
jgi:type I restriction enzyme S subunit